MEGGSEDERGEEWTRDGCLGLEEVPGSWLEIGMGAATVLLVGVVDDCGSLSWLSGPDNVGGTRGIDDDDEDDGVSDGEGSCVGRVLTLDEVETCLCLDDGRELDPETFPSPSTRSLDALLTFVVGVADEENFLSLSGLVRLGKESSSITAESSVVSELDNAVRISFIIVSPPRGSEIEFGDPETKREPDLGLVINPGPDPDLPNVGRRAEVFPPLAVTDEDESPVGVLRPVDEGTCEALLLLLEGIVVNDR